VRNPPIIRGRIASIPKAYRSPGRS
jgi:hypothetical protein